MADDKKNQDAEAPKADAPKGTTPAQAETYTPRPQAADEQGGAGGPTGPPPPQAEPCPPRLRADYEQRIAAAMTEKFGYKNKLEVPRLGKIVINMGVGEATQDKKKVEAAAVEMQAIAGQKPVITKAKTSIAQFKLREGMPIGCKVTLRRDRMYEFLDRLVTVALPRVRDFRGLNPKSFDGRGNYALGLKEQIIFPEINYDQIEKVRGMDVIITTTAKTDEEARELLRLFNFPFPPVEAEAQQAA